jgi:hypothetical protein
VSGRGAGGDVGTNRFVIRRWFKGHTVSGPEPVDPWRTLAVAVLLRAVRDSLTDPDAVTWLRREGDRLAHALGWPAGMLRDYDPERVDWRVLSPWGYGWKFPRRTTPWP